MTTSRCQLLLFLPVPHTDTVVIIKTNIGQLLSITCKKIIITRSEKRNFLVICNVDDEITMIMTLPWSLGKQRAVSLWVQSRYNILDIHQAEWPGEPVCDGASSEFRSRNVMTERAAAFWQSTCRLGVHTDRKLSLQNATTCLTSHTRPSTNCDQQKYRIDKVFWKLTIFSSRCNAISEVLFSS